MGGTCSTYWAGKRCVQGFGGKICGKETTWKTQAYMEDDIKMDLQEVECEGMEWIELAQDRGRWRSLVNAVMHLVP